MKITKSFEMGVSGKYQNYRFGTVVESDDAGKDPEQANRDLMQLAINATLNDIDMFMVADVDFKAVFLARQEELDRYKATLKAKGKM